MIYDKPYLPTNKLIELLQSRGVEIDDPDFAAVAIESHSYYTIVNGYKNSFLSPDGKSYAKGTKFSDLYNLHMIDTNLSSLLFKYILFVERELKNRISQLVASKYGVYTDVSDKSNVNRADYLCRYFYHSCRKRNNILLHLKDSMDPSVNKHCNSIVEHYAQNHNHIPPWIMVTNIPLGLTIEWYYILSPADKTAICDQMVPASSALTLDERKEFFLAALYILKKYRNDIAHGYRVLNCDISTELPKKQALVYSFGTLGQMEYLQGYGVNDIYALSIILCTLLGDRNVVGDFYSDLVNFIQRYASTILSGHTLSEVLQIPADFVIRLDQIYKKSVAAK